MSASFTSQTLMIAGLLVPIVLPAMAVIILWRYEKRRLAKTNTLGPICEHCGYLLIGLSENRCPECGKLFDEPITRQD